MPSGNLCYIPRHRRTLESGMLRALASTDIQLGCKVSIYCDASMIRTDGSKVSDLGSWAFVIPSVPLSESGIERGMKNTELELVAAIRGCERALALGHQKDVLNICSDCNYTESWVNELARRAADRRQRSGLQLHRISDGKLVAQLSSVMERAKVRFTRVTSSTSEHHGRCHTLARETLRANLEPEERKRIVSAARVDEIQKYRARLVEKLAGVDAWLATHSDLI